MKGKFITFEGSEGCGKSTQSRLLYEYLKKQGRRVIYLREPGGTATSEKIRRILLDPANHISALGETLLYMASRAEVVSKVIKPALLEGKIVICDRFLDSTVTYQGYGLGVDINFIKAIGRFVNSGIRAHLTILLDLPVQDGLKHRKFTEDRIEKRSYAYHLRVRRGYLTLAVLEPKRIKIVKVKKNKSVTQGEIRKLVIGILKN